MRATPILVLTVLILSGANGGFLDALSSAFSGLGTTLHSVFDPVLATAVDAGKHLGSSLLTQAQQAGSLLLSQTAQSKAFIISWRGYFVSTIFTLIHNICVYGTIDNYMYMFFYK